MNCLWTFCGHFSYNNLPEILLPNKVTVMFILTWKSVKNLFVLIRRSAPLRQKTRHNKLSRIWKVWKNINYLLWQLLSENWYYKMLFSIKFWTTFYYFIFFAVIQRVIIIYSISTVTLISTGGPCIVPFYIPEKYGLMQNSTMQDILNRAILNGTMQGIFSIQKWYNARILTYLQMVLLRNSTAMDPLYILTYLIILNIF